MSRFCLERLLEPRDIQSQDLRCPPLRGTHYANNKKIGWKLPERMQKVSAVVAGGAAVVVDGNGGDAGLGREGML